MQGESSSLDGAAVAKMGTPGGPERQQSLPGDGWAHLAFWARCPSPPESFVYVIQAEGDSPIKVGWTVNVPKRMLELQTGNPRRLHLLHALVGEQRLEHFLHRRLGRQDRMIGEWFDGEGVEPFLAFVAGLANRMVTGYEATNVLPRWWDFLPSNWRLYSSARTNPSASLKIRHVEPSPVATANALQRARRKVAADLEPLVA